ncbi:MAG: bifunctional phosphoserine phosphatase/homoserine phosphotransferase ThrH, partial [Nitrospira sp.]|nr:bifunctional phosphoserine phosphatase/homoserine phosphotransferase ThrH [Nitrospira sp.]
IDLDGRIVNYHMRMQNPKKHAVASLKALNFFTMAAGDSYNDIGMLYEADKGVFFRPPDPLQKEFPAFPVTQTYGELQDCLVKVGCFPT